MYCPRCGAIAPHERKCENCGESLLNYLHIDQAGGRTASYRLASPWLRYAAHYIDATLVGFLAAPFALPVWAWITFVWPVDGLKRALMNLLIAWSAFITFQCVYHAVFESSSLQATPGKWVTKIRVMSAQGGKVSILQACVRALLKLVTLLAGGLPGLFMFLSPLRQALHDRVAGTVVVERSSKAVRPPGRF